MTDVQQAVPVAQAADELRSLIEKATQEDLNDDGIYFGGRRFDDLTQCHHGETGRYQHEPDGKLVEWLWNHRNFIAERLSPPCKSEDDAGVREPTDHELKQVVAACHWHWSRGEPAPAIAKLRQLIPATPDATQTQEAETWVPRIGDPVKVSDSCEHSTDWQRTHLWVAGVAVDERCRGINVTVTEQWPVPHRFVGRDYMGHTDGFLVARTDGKPDDLEPRAVLNGRDAA